MIRYYFDTKKIPTDTTTGEALQALIQGLNLIITPEAYYRLPKRLQHFWVPYEKEQS